MSVPGSLLRPSHGSCYDLLALAQDAGLSATTSPACRLHILLGEHTLHLAVVDASAQLCLALGSYACAQGWDPHSLQAWYSQSGLGQCSWQDIYLGITHPLVTSIPTPLVDTQQLPCYLQALFAQDTPPTQAFCNHHPKWDLSICFAAPDTAIALQKSLPPNPLHWVHQHSSLLRALDTLHANGSQHLMLHLSGSQAHLACMQGSVLRYSNAIHYRTSDEVLGYVMAVIAHLQLNRKEVPCSILGHISTQSMAYDKLRRYIGHVHKVAAPLPLGLAAALQHMDPHHYLAVLWLGS